jgi:hypothetical protein
VHVLSGSPALSAKGDIRELSHGLYRMVPFKALGATSDSPKLSIYSPSVLTNLRMRQLQDVDVA